MNLTNRTLGEICDEVGGTIRTGPFGSQLHQSDYSDEGTPVVMPKDIIGDKISIDDIARVGPEHTERLSQHKLLLGDIVYGRRGDIGRRAIVTEREQGWLCGTGSLRISLGFTNPVLDPLFLYYYLGHPKIIEWIYNQAIGATMPNLNASIIRSIPITYPSLSEQRRIAAVLSAYDDLIENNTQRIKALEAAAQALYREWFVEFRFPGHESVEWVESALGRIPRGWEVCQVAKVAKVFRGRSYRSEDLVKEGGLPFLNLKCIERDGGFRYDGLKYYAGKYQETHKAQPGDIIMAVTDMTQERRIVARAALVPEIGEATFIYSMDLVKIVPFEDISSEYLYGMFRFSHFPDEVKQHANGANVLHLSPDRITEFEFVLPPFNLRTRYSSICADLYRQSDTLHRKNAILREARDLLLPRLISSELSVENVPLPDELDFAGR